MIMDTCPDLLEWEEMGPGGSANCPGAWPTREGVNMPDPTCSIEGCAKPKYIRGWCMTHYTRWLKWGDPNKVLLRPQVSACQIEGCKRHGPFTRGWCQMHYIRWQKSGDPLVVAIYRGPSSESCSVDGCEKPGRYRRTFCQMHYIRWKKYGDPLVDVDSPQSREGSCEADGCEKPIQRRRRCVMHAHRFETYGSDELPPRSQMHYSHGYIKVRAPEGHPVANVAGWALQHRIVLWNEVGSGTQHCHWCAGTLEWDLPRDDPRQLTVDHLDWDRANNDPENLVPACRACNTGRQRETA